MIFASKRSKPKTLQALQRVTRELEEGRLERRALIGRARSAGATWAEIGAALGMSPSGASSLVRPAKPPTLEEQQERLEERLEEESKPPPEPVKPAYPTYATGSNEPRSNVEDLG